MRVMMKRIPYEGESAVLLDIVALIDVFTHAYDFQGRGTNQVLENAHPDESWIITYGDSG